MAAASVGPSPPAPDSRTVSAMRKTSGAVLGKSHRWTPCVGEHGDLPRLCPALTNCYCSADSVKHDLETSAMPVCCWWKGGKSSQWEPRRTGIMWVAGYIFVMVSFFFDAYEAVKSLGLGCWCTRRSQPKDNLQAQKDKVHIKESTSQSDQQTAKGAEAEQWVSVHWHEWYAWHQSTALTHTCVMFF